MGQAILYGQKQQGVDIQGIVDDYYAYAGENISAGDFVEFINGVARSTNYTSNLAYFSLYSPSDIAISLIAENKFIIAYYNVKGNVANQGIARIGTVANATITFGDEYIFDATSVSYPSIAQLTDNKFIIAYKSSYNVKAIVGTVSDTTITFGTALTVETGTSSAPCISPKIINNTTTITPKALIVFSHTSIKACMLTISGTTVTKSTVYTLVSKGIYFSICKLADAKFLMVYADGNDSSYGKAMLVTTSGNNVSGGTSYTFCSNALFEMKVCSLTDSKVFIMYQYQQNVVGKAIIANISSNAINFGSEYIINNTEGLYGLFDICKIDTNKVVIAYPPNVSVSSRTGIMHIVTVSDSVITLQTATQFSNKYTNYSALLLFSDDVVILAWDTYYNSTNNQGYSRMFDCSGNIPSTTITKKTYETQVRKVTTPQFDGIAQTSGTGGSATAHNQQVEVLTIANPTE